MNTFPIQADVALVIMAFTIFVTGWISHLALSSRRERQMTKQLTDKVAHLERQCDAAHRSALDMAATNARLMGEHKEGQWIIQSLKSDNRLQEDRIEKLLEGHESCQPAVNEEIWAADDLQFGAAISRD